MNIGRTVRVFRAEPVVDPLPGEGPEAGTAADDVVAQARAGTRPEALTDTGTGQHVEPAPVPTRTGG